MKNFLHLLRSTTFDSIFGTSLGSTTMQSPCSITGTIIVQIIPCVDTVNRVIVSHVTYNASPLSNIPQPHCIKHTLQTSQLSLAIPLRVN